MHAIFTWMMVKLVVFQVSTFWLGLWAFSTPEMASKEASGDLLNAADEDEKNRSASVDELVEKLEAQNR